MSEEEAEQRGKRAKERERGRERGEEINLKGEGSYFLSLKQNVCDK